MKSLMIRSALVLSSLVLISAAPAAAQSFQAQIDCGGVFNPGDPVSATVRLESQSFSAVELEVVVEVHIPGVGVRTRSQTVTLGANQDLSKTHTVILPDGAPLGDYDLTVTAQSDTEMTFDTCSFKVE